ncbi:MAG: helix-turn-helix transcriptional regulator [Clostridiales bacterium]|nr:helix-turn-helix transcriptional regulator [Clostridiales bacterium]
MQLDKATIGTRIKYERLRLGLTLEEFGRQVGVSKQCLSGWEHGRNMPDVVALNTMAELCGIEIRDFLQAEPTENDRQRTKENEPDRFTDKERQIINKIRALSTERRKAVEVLLGVRDKK